MLWWIPGVIPRNQEISVSDSVHSLSSRYYFKFPNNICQQVWPSYIWSKIYLYPLCDYLVYHWFNCCTSFWSSLCFQRHCGKYQPVFILLQEWFVRVFFQIWGLKLNKLKWLGVFFSFVVYFHIRGWREEYSVIVYLV